LSSLGYRLFSQGIVAQAGDLDGGVGKFKIKISKAAPGTFFALFGTVIIAVTIFYSGFKSTTEKTTTTTTTDSLNAKKSVITTETVTETTTKKESTKK
jgi:hypothetical protein